MRKLLALAVAVLMATPAFAAVQNVKVSGDIDSTYINRQNFNLGLKAGSAFSAGDHVGLNDQSAFLTQTRVRIDADLSDNVSTTVGLINERAWDSEQSSDTDVQLYLAYATLREFLYSPLSVTVGRQIFHYGNGLIIGDGGPNNGATNNLATVASDLTKRSTYDGVKAVLDYKPLTLDMIYFRNTTSATNNGSLNSLKDDSDVYGINANYQLGDERNSAIEGYFFTRLTGDRNSTVNTNISNTGITADQGDVVYVPGLRVSTNPIKGLNTSAELAWQLGRKGATQDSTINGGDNIKREAMAAQVMGSYSIQSEDLEKYKPTISGSYTYVSGDKNGDIGRPGSPAPKSDETYSAWDPLFENQGSGTIYNTLFNLTNMHIWSVGVQANPLEDVTAKFTWSGLWSASDYGTENTLKVLQPDRTATLNSLATFATESDERGIGNEYDVNVEYAYTEDVKIGMNLGWFVPGSVFTNANDTTATQALAHVLVNF